jgi:membrane associated rhomboid family serine protease
MADPVTLRTGAGDEHLDLVEFEARVRLGEVDPAVLVCLPAVTGGRFVPAGQLELYQRLHEPRRAHFSRAFTLLRFPWLTSAIIFLNLAVFLATAENGQLELDAMVRYGGKVGPLITDLGELWRLFTANFLHRDAVHLGVNMFVLFNVGGALENTYRTLDYLWLLVFTGIATMATSLLLNDAITIGASGMVFGCLGGVVAFGLKYRSSLPAKYRSLLADAAIPTVLGLLFIGITSHGVDTWAHIGGLVAGLLTGSFMRPRLLIDARRFWWEPALRAAPSLAVLAVVFFGQPLFFGNGLPMLRLERDDGYGLSMPVPRAWVRGANPLGALAWYNGLSGLGRASVATEAVEMPEGGDAQATAARFVAERLVPGSLGADVLSVTAEPVETVRLGERDAMRVKATVDSTTGATRLAAWFVPQGTLVFQFVFVWPVGYGRYALVSEQMMSGLRFEEPRSLRQVRGEALVFPNSPPALARLGEAMLEQGEAMPAAEALSAAVRGGPSIFEWRVALSRAWLAAGEVERACAAATDAKAYAPEEPLVLEALARCELARGNPARALEQLQQASSAAPGDERLKAAEAKLRASLGGP